MTARRFQILQRRRTSARHQFLQSQELAFVLFLDQRREADAGSRPGLGAVLASPLLAFAQDVHCPIRRLR